MRERERHHNGGSRKVIYRNFVKRAIDFLVALILMPFVLVSCMIIGPLIFLEDHGTVFYKAKRRGRNGVIFTMYKFRSMKMNAPDIRYADNSAYNSENDSRVTKIGKLLRKTSLDEVPQLFNVLKGDMSIVGPRPVSPIKPTNEFDEKRWIRLSVRPGITGYSQAYFRNSIDQETKFQYDAEYARNVSFMLDVKIICKTIVSVLKKENIYNNKVR